MFLCIQFQSVAVYHGLLIIKHKPSILKAEGKRVQEREKTFLNFFMYTHILTKTKSNLGYVQNPNTRRGGSSLKFILYPNSFKRKSLNLFRTKSGWVGWDWPLSLSPSLPNATKCTFIKSRIVRFCFVLFRFRFALYMCPEFHWPLVYIV